MLFSEDPLERQILTQLSNRLATVINGATGERYLIKTLDYNLKTILDHCRNQAYLTKGVKITIIDKRKKEKGKGQKVDKENGDKEFYRNLKEYTFYFEGGIRSYVKHLNHNKEPLTVPPIYIEKEKDGIQIEVALQYTDSFNENIYGKCESISC